jgi:hypothetical protein
MPNRTPWRLRRAAKHSRKNSPAVWSGRPGLEFAAPPGVARGALGRSVDHNRIGLARVAGEGADLPERFEVKHPARHDRREWSADGVYHARRHGRRGADELDAVMPRLVDCVGNAATRARGLSGAIWPRASPGQPCSGPCLGSARLVKKLLTS